MSTDATRAHVNAETLAAWADHGLSADAAAAVELHLSNCERCQEMLAAFVRSAPTAGAVVIPFWARRPVQWSAAGLAAAAALVAMVWTSRPPAVPTPTATVASVSANSPTPVPPVLPVEHQSRANKTVERRVEQKKESAPARPAAIPAPPPPAAVTAAAPVIGSVGASRPAEQAQAFSMDALSITPPVEIVAPEPAPAAAGRTELSQPPVRMRWRIIAGTRVERSIDAGVTWTALPIEPALTTPLEAGVATSQSNCWLVGREGVVLVTSDGRTFRRVSLPESVQLVSVIATDALRATVTAVDGRMFSTIDGGLTWK